MYRYLTFFLLFALALNFIKAQPQGKQLVDSLNAKIAVAEEDTAKVIMLCKLSFAYYSIDPLMGIKVGKQAVDLAEKLKWKRGIAKAYNNIATNYNVKSDYYGALNNYLSALKIYEEIRDTSGIATVLVNIGINYLDRGDYSKAGDNFSEALKLYKSTGDKKGISIVQENLGGLYFRQKRYDLSIQSFKGALDYAISMNDRESEAMSANNLATVYNNLGNYTEALSYHQKSFILFKELGSRRGQASAYSGMADLYAKLYEPGAKNGNSGLEENIKQNLLLAEENYLKALEIYKEVGDLSATSRAYQCLSDLQLLFKNPETALQYYKNYVRYKDSAFSQKNAEKIVQIQTKYDLEKAEAEAKYKAELEKAEADRKNYLQIAGIVAFVLMITSALLLLRKRKIKPVFLKLLGTFSLLVIFEFISLLLHPHIVNLTHHNLVFTLLCLVLLASIIIPTHHKIEHWMHEKLVKHHIIEPSSDVKEEAEVNDSKPAT